MPKLVDLVELFSNTRKKDRKRKPVKQRRRLLTEQLESRQLLAANPIFQLDLSQDRDLSYLDNDGWDLSASVQTNTAGAEDFRIVNQSLWLTDDLNGTEGGGHAAYRGFGELGAKKDISNGLIRVSAGTNGASVGGGRRITLMAEGKRVARIQLSNSTSGELQIVDTNNRSTAESIPFSDDSSWHGEYRDLLIQWTVNDNGEDGLVSLSFQDSNGDVTSLLERPFINAGVPDGVELTAGWSTSVDATLQINSLEVFEGPLISEIKEPDYFDIAMGSVAGAAVTGQLHLETPIQGPPPEFEIVSGNEDGLFTIETISESQDRYLGRLRVAPGMTLSNQTGSVELEVQVTGGLSKSTTEMITIDIVEQTDNELIRESLEGTAAGQSEAIDSSQVVEWMALIDESGDFSDINNDYWLERSHRIGSLARVYGLGSGDAPDHQGSPELREKLYRAVTFFGNNFRFHNFPWDMTGQLAAAGYFLHDDIHADLLSDDDDRVKIAKDAYDAILLASEPVMTAQPVDGSYWGGNHALRMNAMYLRSAFMNDYNRPTIAGEMSDELVAVSRGFVPTGSFVDLQFLHDASFETAADFDSVGRTPDGGFNMHTSGQSQLYLYGYGSSWVNQMLGVAVRMQETKWASTVDQLNQAADYLLDGYRWTLYEGVSDHFAKGRHIAQRELGTSNGSILGMLNRLLGTPDNEGAATGLDLERRDELEAFQAALNDSPGQDLSGNRGFWNYDFMVHRDDNFYVSNMMNSLRTAGNEYGATRKDSPNRKAYHMGDGAMLIMRTGDEWDNSRIGWDWRHLPGTTTESRTTDLPNLNFNNNNGGLNAFAGVASDGVYGASAFINDRYDESRLDIDADDNFYQTHIYHTIKSNKGNFFFDDAVVALGSGITRMNTIAEGTVLTTLNQVEWQDDVTYFIGGDDNPTIIPRGNLVDLDLEINSESWFHQDGVGYIVLPTSGETVDVRLETKSTNNDWHDINPEIAENTTEQVDMFHLSIDHGANPAGGKYQYLVVPNIAASEMPAYVDNLPIEVVANTELVQAVRHAKEQVTQIVFYEAGSINVGGLTVTSDQPALVVLTEHHGAMEVTVSDPLHRTDLSEINLTISRELTGDGAIWNAGESTLTFELSDEIMLAGQAMTKRFDAPGLIGPFTPISWDFAEDQTLAQLEDAGWKLGEATPLDSAAHPEEDFRVEGGALLLIDDADAGDGQPGWHTADYVFGDAEQGRLTLRAGTTGDDTRRGNHLIALVDSSGTSIATIKLTDNVKGVLYAGATDSEDKVDFTDAQSWNDSATANPDDNSRLFSIAWRANATGDEVIVSLSFTDRNGDVTRLEDVSVPGSAPQELRLRAGWGAPKNNGLRIEELELTDNPQVIFHSEFSSERSLADLKAAGWKVDHATNSDQDGLEDFNVTGGYLELTDDAGPGLPSRYDHEATYDFRPTATGRLIVEAGTAGTYVGDVNHRIELRSGGNVIGAIELTDDTNGVLQVGSETLDFSDTSWHNSLDSTNYREVIFDWRADADSVGDRGMLTVQMKKSDDMFIRLSAIPYSGGVPDNLHLRAGNGPAADASLRLDRLQLTQSPPVEFIRQFDQDKSQEELVAAGWTVNPATQTDGPQAGDAEDDFQVTNGYLQLTDDAGTGESQNGTHTASYEFGAIDDGAIEISAGTAGTQNGNGLYTIGLRRGDTLIGFIEFTNHSNGRLVVGSQETTFSDETWNGGFRDLQITWQMNDAGTGGEISLSFKAADDTLTQLTDASFEGGAPDNLLLSLGRTWLKNISLRVDSLSIVSNETIN